MRDLDVSLKLVSTSSLILPVKQRIEQTSSSRRTLQSFRRENDSLTVLAGLIV